MKMKKMKEMFLLTLEKCWLLDEKLLPFYQHLVDDYSDKLREEYTVEVEETDVEVVQQVKEEPQDDYLVEPQQVHLNNSTNQFKVIIPLLLIVLLRDILMNYTSIGLSNTIPNPLRKSWGVFLSTRRLLSLLGVTWDSSLWISLYFLLCYIKRFCKKSRFSFIRVIGQ